MAMRPEVKVVGLSFVVNVSIRATTQYTRPILCTQRFKIVLKCVYFALIIFNLIIYT